MSARPDATASEVLDALAELPGLLRACVFEVGTGTVRSAIGADGRPPTSLLAWARHASEVSRQRGHTLEDVIVTSTEAHHLLRELPPSGASPLWVHVEVDGRRGNLALARRRLTRATQRPAPAAARVPVPRVPAAPVPAASVPAASVPAASVPAASVPAARPPAARTPALPAAAPALTMLPALDEQWREPVVPAPRSPLPTTTLAAALAAAPVAPAPAPSPAPTEPTPTEPTPTEPTPTEPTEPAAPVEPAAPARTAPRRVPLMGRPPIAFVVPPTVPPPPLPGAEPEAAPEVGEPEPERPAAGETADGDAPQHAAEDAALATADPVLPTRTPGEHVPAVPSPAAHRARERSTGWGTDGSTLRRLLVGLRRLA